MSATVHSPVVRRNNNKDYPRAKSKITSISVAPIDVSKALEADYEATTNHVLQGVATGKGFFVTEIVITDDPEGLTHHYI